MTSRPLFFRQSFHVVRSDDQITRMESTRLDVLVVDDEPALREVLSLDALEQL